MSYEKRITAEESYVVYGTARALIKKTNEK